MKMRKNKMMRAASVLLVAVMLTTCAISGTFAKYTTSATGSDEARVAKWGVTVNATGNAFAKTYKTDDSSASSTITNSVVSSETDDNSKNVLAPGTSGSLSSATISGTPEVAVEVTYSATLSLSNWYCDSNNTEYCPIVFTVNNATYGTNDTKATNKSENISALITAVQNAIADHTETYAAGTDLGEQTAGNLSVSWEWAYETGADDSAKTANSVKDTYLGDQAAAGTAASISLSVTTTVTQVD